MSSPGSWRRLHFGHCIGCDQPIRPPYLSFKVSLSIDDGNSVEEWDEVDVCDGCVGKLTAADLHRLVSADEEAAATDEHSRERVSP